MIVKSLVTGFDLTEGKEYEVFHEYDTVYELKCDTGTYCRAKDFFLVIEETKHLKNIEKSYETIVNEKSVDTKSKMNKKDGSVDLQERLESFYGKPISEIEPMYSKEVDFGSPVGEEVW